MHHTYGFKSNIDDTQNRSVYVCALTSDLNLGIWESGNLAGQHEQFRRRPTRPSQQLRRSYQLNFCDLSMGITGLLKELKPVTEKRNIKEYRNRRIAIDGYAWLHKAVFGCCVELATGVESTKWISYCLRLVDMLLDNEILVHMVFDGANLPAKDGVEKVRAESRKKALESGLKLLSSDNKSDRDLARRHLVGAVDVTPFMAGQLIQALREQRPQVISSPLLLCNRRHGCS